MDLSPESRAQTIAMVIGLRIAHSTTGKLNEISQGIESNIKVTGLKAADGEGTLNIKNIIQDPATKEVTSVEYEITDKVTGVVKDK